VYNTEEIDLPLIGCSGSCTDKDGNGTVEFDEFYTWYSGSSKAMGRAEVKVLAYLKRSKDPGS
jgi:Ca2+-binding EF-hand superfamily protein